MFCKEYAISRVNTTLKRLIYPAAAMRTRQSLPPRQRSFSVFFLKGSKVNILHPSFFLHNGGCYLFFSLVGHGVIISMFVLEINFRISSPSPPRSFYVLFPGVCSSFGSPVFSVRLRQRNFAKWIRMPQIRVIFANCWHRTLSAKGISFCPPLCRKTLVGFIAMAFPFFKRAVLTRSFLALCLSLVKLALPNCLVPCRRCLSGAFCSGCGHCVEVSYFPLPFFR